MEWKSIYEEFRPKVGLQFSIRLWIILPYTVHYMFLFINYLLWSLVALSAPNSLPHCKQSDSPALTRNIIIRGKFRSKSKIKELREDEEESERSEEENSDNGTSHSGIGHSESLQEKLLPKKKEPATKGSSKRRKREPPQRQRRSIQQKDHLKSTSVPRQESILSYMSKDREAEGKEKREFQASLPATKQQELAKKKSPLYAEESIDEAAEGFRPAQQLHRDDQVEDEGRIGISSLERELDSHDGLADDALARKKNEAFSFSLSFSPSRFTPPLDSSSDEETSLGVREDAEEEDYGIEGGALASLPSFDGNKEIDDAVLPSTIQLSARKPASSRQSSDSDDVAEESQAPMVRVEIALLMNVVYRWW